MQMVMKADNAIMKVE